MANMYGNVEIFKEGNSVTNEEIGKIYEICRIIRSYNDTANEIVAFDLACDTNTAEDIVDALNEMGENASWYVGAEDEEYVYVN